MPATPKKNLTVRLDDETREKLELIANREFRPLANQLVVFAIQGIRQYMEANNLIFIERTGFPGIEIAPLSEYQNRDSSLTAGSTLIDP